MQHDPKVIAQLQKLLGVTEERAIQLAEAAEGAPPSNVGKEFTVRLTCPGPDGEICDVAFDARAVKTAENGFDFPEDPACPDCGRTNGFTLDRPHEAQ